ncbi:MAG: hypothetical protein HZA24_06300 [Nitrospirae bacterium]|nr:hypothetical protein [Nitrospirota bacterium]
MTPERRRDIAYLCFLALGGCVLAVFLGDALGRSGWLPRPLAAGLLVFVLMPLTFAGVAAALAGVVLAVWVGSDARLYALALLAMGLVVFWMRLDQHGAAPAWVLAYPAGAALFSLRWLLTRRRA